MWWLRLGLRLERIEPGKPQQNGRLERLHRTLEEVVGSPARDQKTQQRALDLWRLDYNQVRPHEALGMSVPADAYQRSPRGYPRKLIDSRDTLFVERDTIYRLDKQGRLQLRPRGHKIHISSALSFEYVIVERSGERWTYLDVSFGGIRLGTIDTERLDRGLRIPRRRRGKVGEVSTMSLD